MTKSYEAWREKEAYAIPVTDEGIQQSVFNAWLAAASAEVRWNSFKAGWNAAVDEAVKLLKEKQEGVDVHNMFIVSAQIIKVLKNEC